MKVKNQLKTIHYFAWKFQRLKISTIGFSTGLKGI
jgi:hypothetical protein